MKNLKNKTPKTPPGIPVQPKQKPFPQATGYPNWPRKIGMLPGSPQDLNRNPGDTNKP